MNKRTHKIEVLSKNNKKDPVFLNFRKDPDADEIDIVLCDSQGRNIKNGYILSLVKVDGLLKMRRARCPNKKYVCRNRNEEIDELEE